MGCCMSKQEPGSDAATPPPSTPPQQAVITSGDAAADPAPPSPRDNARAERPNEAETAAIASAIARTLADTTPTVASSPPATEPNIPNEHYFLPPTVFVPDESGREIDFFRTDERARETADDKKKKKKKKKSTGDSSSSSTSSSQSSAKSGAKAASSEH